MLDLPHLRTYTSVITVSEYLQLHDLSPDVEWSNGAWHREVYHSGTPKPSFGVIPNGEYDPSGIVRVDRMPPARHDLIEDRPWHAPLLAVMGTRNAIPIGEARTVVQRSGFKVSKEEGEFEEELERNGWAILHTFAGA